jgi:two-component SAPR family response regulator
MNRHERIIFVDDDPDTNFYHQVVFKRIKRTSEIIVFQKGTDALKYLEKEINNFNLLFLDINMPIMNGWQFLKHYEKLDEKIKSKTFIVMLTSSTNYDDKTKAERIPSVKKYFNKPLTPDVINNIFELFDYQVSNGSSRP